VYGAGDLVISYKVCEGGTIQSDAAGVRSGPSCGYTGNSM